MPFNHKKPAGPNTNGPLPLLLYAASHHPQSEIQSQLWSALECWLESLNPLHSHELVETALKKHPGTPLEPLLLKDEERRIASFLSRVAFSRTGRQTRIRLNSSLNPSTKGGLILTHNLQGYFVERLSVGSNTRSSNAHWAFNPGIKPDLRKLPPRLPAHGWIGEHGYEVVIDLRNTPVEKWNLHDLKNNALISNSLLIETKKSLLSEGFDVWGDGGQLHVALARAERMIRLGPKISSKEGMWINLRGGDKEMDQPQLRLEFKISERRPQPVVAQLVVGQTDLGGWLHTDCLASPSLPEELQRCLEEWMPITNNWKHSKKGNPS